MNVIIKAMRETIAIFILIILCSVYLLTVPLLGAWFLVLHPEVTLLSVIISIIIVFCIIFEVVLLPNFMDFIDVNILTKIEGSE